MRTSAPGCSDPPCRQNGARGFTLIELLVVLVIVAAGLTLAVIALRPDHRAVVRHEGDRLAALLDLAGEESGVSGLSLAWVGKADGYEFHARELTELGPEWTLVRGDDLLHPRQLPQGALIRSIVVDGQPLEFGQRVPLGDTATNELAVEIAVGDARVVVSGSAGRFESAPVVEAGS